MIAGSLPMRDACAVSELRSRTYIKVDVFLPQPKPEWRSVIFNKCFCCRRHQNCKLSTTVYKKAGFLFSNHDHHRWPSESVVLVNSNSNLFSNHYHHHTSQHRHYHHIDIYFQTLYFKEADPPTFVIQTQERQKSKLMRVFIPKVVLS